ncbi:MAG TPA: ATP-grasp domain-containing protein [Nitrososphaeraceae archaeon]|jgi:carbamoyl-phosphate synthase large subunit|nr:ATP-grasp domain-containing protein [Nitrososphaeraceae archaeon]
MDTFNVLVPGAGGPAGINTIKSLRLSLFKGNIVSTDSNSLSAGFFLSDFYYVIPPYDDKFFVEKLLKIIKEQNIKVLMPSSGFDIYGYSLNYDLIVEYGAIPIVSRRKVLEICRDKLLSYKFLSNKFPFAFTCEYHEKIDTFPLIAKPRFGKGSNNIIKIENKLDLKYVLGKFKNMIFQEYLPGTEYTVDVLSDLTEKPIMAIPRIRIDTKAGISVKGKIKRDLMIENLCKKTAETLGIKGPCCIQLKESENGELKIIEINPRFGGGTIFTTLAGANFPAMLLEMISNNNNNNLIIPKVSEVTVLRYFEEIVIE